jgi:two-component system chemotaxis response regulator CheY
MHAIVRTVIGLALTSAGHHVVGQADTAALAVERFDELHPDVTTLDITMPGESGLVALARIIAVEPDARVVMCSALREASTALQAARLGAREFVVKPPRRVQLLAAVESALA